MHKVAPKFSRIAVIALIAGFLACLITWLGDSKSSPLQPFLSGSFLWELWIYVNLPATVFGIAIWAWSGLSDGSGPIIGYLTIFSYWCFLSGFGYTFGKGILQLLRKQETSVESL
jgi:hypothetical protein